jgi:hypothetical protein
MIFLLTPYHNRTMVSGNTLLYYKGSAMPYCVKDPKAFYEGVKQASNKMIVLGLREGISIKDQIDLMCGQLDRMENEMYVITNKKAWNTGQLIDAWGEEEFDKRSRLWCLNIEALLQLRAIQNDDMNGWLFMITR